MTCLDTLGIVFHLLVRRLLLAEKLAARLISQAIDLLAQERLDSSIHARDQPEEGVDKVNPDSRLHGRGAASLVRRLVAVPVEEDAGEDAKDDDPGDEEGGVPGECAVGLCDLDPGANEGDGTDRRGNDKQHSRDGRQTSHEDSKDPLGGEAIIGFPIGINAVAVEATGDNGEEELQGAADEARNDLEGLEPGLADFLTGVGALVVDVTTGLAAEFALVGVAEVLGCAGEAVGGFAEFDGLHGEVHFAHFAHFGGVWVLVCE
jgi:hypothetical protein